MLKTCSPRRVWVSVHSQERHVGLHAYLLACTSLYPTNRNEQKWRGRCAESRNQGYGYEHNCGHGEKNLSVVFALLMMLAFYVDQVLQLCDPLFQGALQKLGSKRLLWERMRSLFYEYHLRSLRELYEALYYGCHRPRPRINFNTS